MSRALMRSCYSENAKPQLKMSIYTPTGSVDSGGRTWR